MQDVMYFLRTEVDIDSLECSVQLISINGTTSIDVKKVEHLTECYSGKFITTIIIAIIHHIAV